MKKIFLVSSLDNNYKTNDKRFPKVINNENRIIEQLKDNLTKVDSLLCFASSPDNYEKTDSYAKITYESFKMSGFNFKMMTVVDNRYQGNLRDDINKADLIFLMGGHTLTQMQFFERINLRDLLKNYDGVIMGQSAGALNLADMVVCSPEDEEEIDTDYVWQGLGLTKINIEPHFILEPTNTLEERLREELLKLSDKYQIYAIPDGSHIFDDGEQQTLYGEGYLVNKRKIKMICEKGKKVKL